MSAITLQSFIMTFWLKLRCCTVGNDVASCFLVWGFKFCYPPPSPPWLELTHFPCFLLWYKDVMALYKLVYLNSLYCMCPMTKPVQGVFLAHELLGKLPTQCSLEQTLFSKTSSLFRNTSAHLLSSKHLYWFVP